jgi:hypothetical protein
VRRVQGGITAAHQVRARLPRSRADERQTCLDARPQFVAHDAEIWSRLDAPLGARERLCHPLTGAGPALEPLLSPNLQPGEPLVRSFDACNLIKADPVERGGCAFE